MSIEEWKGNHLWHNGLDHVGRLDISMKDIEDAFQAGKAEGAEEQKENDAQIIETLTSAIQRALDDEESGKGWGPDVTVCGYLSDALKAVRSR